MRSAWVLLIAVVAGCDKGTPATATATASASATATTVAPGGAGHGPAPLFWYQEDGDSVAFWSPNVVVLTRRGDGGAPKVCRSELGERGNMYSGPEVENAFKNPDVQKALAGNVRFTSGATGKLGAGSSGNALEWVTACATCAGDTGGVAQAHQVMRTLMLNRRLLCP